MSPENAETCTGVAFGENGLEKNRARESEEIAETCTGVTFGELAC